MLEVKPSGQRGCTAPAVAETGWACVYRFAADMLNGIILGLGDNSGSFYRAMLCIRGTSHGPVSVCLSVSVCHKSEFY